MTMPSMKEVQRKNVSKMRMRYAGMACVALSCAVVFLSGCTVATTAAPTGSEGPLLVGAVHGGQQPVSGAVISMYETNSSGYNSAPTLLATATTGGDGSWSITTSYTCDTGQDAYLIATGGNPGAGGTVDNSALVLAAAMGPCEHVDANTFVSINEVTTVAAAYALSGFAPSGGAGFAKGNITAGFTTTASNTQGLQDAFANAVNIVDSTTGAAFTAPHSTSNGVVPQAMINSLADILQDCVNSTGPGSPACGSLFSAATPPAGSGIAAPVNTLQAALDIAQYPGNNVSTLFGLISPQAAFGPTLNSMPNDWTIAVTYSGAALAGGQGLTIDDKDNVWVSGSTAASLVEFSPVGSTLSPTGGWTSTIASASHTIRNLTFDTAGNLWLPDSSASQIYQYVPGGTPTAPAAGTLTPISYLTANANLAPTYDVGIDGSGNVWFGTYLKKNCANTVGNLCAFAELQKSGTNYTPTSTFNSNTYSLGTLGPKTMAVDANSNSVGFGNVWIAPNSGASTVSLLKSPYSAAPSTVSLPFTGTVPSPQCMAIDASGNAWIGGFSAGLLYKVDPTGANVTQITNTTELQEPNYIVIDGNGNLFLPNFLTSTVAMYSPGFNSGAGSFLSPNTGFNPGATFNSSNSKYAGGVLSGTVEAGVDRAGALWILNQTSGTVTQVLGVAAPTNPVLAAGQYGVKP